MNRRSRRCTRGKRRSGDRSAASFFTISHLSRSSAAPSTCSAPAPKTTTNRPVEHPIRNFQAASHRSRRRSAPEYQLATLLGQLAIGPLAIVGSRIFASFLSGLKEPPARTFPSHLLVWTLGAVSCRGRRAGRCGFRRAGAMDAVRGQQSPPSLPQRDRRQGQRQVPPGTWA
jgi:hypothetical protein